ncbi:MAG: hypothetical protein KJ936_13470 [Proteobacteria bacterium]|nr:hypothetical protein [Pseudomonadota bacterium]MBU2260707.1 hypothetical protein [Pseudomonadota bacterium]
MIISNSSCLIILDKLDRLTVLKELFRQELRLSKTVYESALNLAGESAEHKIMEG